MALATTNLALSAVRTNLGYSADWSLFNIGTSSLINRWSKYKPVRAAGIGTTVYERGKDDVGYWGFNFSGSNPDKWDYLQPRGGSDGGSPDEPARLGDFRGYEHDRTLAYPSIQCRDTDNAWNANLYPSGTPYLQRWYCRAHRSSSSVIILPSDIYPSASSLDDYYVGLKINATGGPWYKTFGQVKDLDFTGAWNISISTEIINWATSPAFANFPYHIGSVDWQLILSSGAAAAWTAISPGLLVFFTGIANGGSPDTWDTDGTNTYITNGSFTIKDWLKVSSNALVHSAAGESEDVTVYCSYAGGPPDWSAAVITGGTWITLSCNDAGTPVNCSLVTSGFNTRVTTAAISDVSSVTVYKDASDSYDYTIQSESGDVNPVLERSPDGLVRVTSNSITQDITVSQGYAGSTALTFTYNPTGGGDFPPSGGTIEYIIKRGATQVYPSSGWATATGQRAEYNNVVNIANIGETAQNTDYTVYIRLVL